MELRFCTCKQDNQVPWPVCVKEDESSKSWELLPRSHVRRETSWQYSSPLTGYWVIIKDQDGHEKRKKLKSFHRWHFPLQTRLRALHSVYRRDGPRAAFGRIGAKRDAKIRDIMVRTNNIQICKIAVFICEDVEIENEAGTNKFCSWDGKLLNFGLAFLKETMEWMKYDILAYRSETSKAFNLSSALFQAFEFRTIPVFCRTHLHW